MNTGFWPDSPACTPSTSLRACAQLPSSPAVPGVKLSSDQRLSLILDTQRAIAAAGDDVRAMMQLIVERSQAIIGADGSMVSVVDGDMLEARAASGIGLLASTKRRPLAGSWRGLRSRAAYRC